MSLDQIDPYPHFLNKPLPLVVNEQIVQTRISATEWADHWRPFLGTLLKHFLAVRPRRFLIAMAGPPGSGKSVLAEQLHWLIDKGFLHVDAHSIALPMDGFHFSNTYLESHSRVLPDGKEILLSTVKGQPDTIDTQSLRQHIQNLIARPESMPWPGYSRYSHDVLPGKFHIERLSNIVIVEGNYLLVDRGPFVGIPALFDLRIYVDAPGPTIISNLVERHIRGGKTLEEAKDWVRRIDLPNARIAESTKSSADVIFARDTATELATVTWKGEFATVSSQGENDDSSPPHLPPRSLRRPPALPPPPSRPLRRHDSQRRYFSYLSASR